MVLTFYSCLFCFVLGHRTWWCSGLAPVSALRRHAKGDSIYRIPRVQPTLAQVGCLRQEPYLLQSLLQPRVSTFNKIIILFCFLGQAANIYKVICLFCIFLTYPYLLIQNYFFLRWKLRISR